MTGLATADRAATWYRDVSQEAPGRPVSNARSKSPRPRALEARGFGGLHHVLVQIADAGLRPYFAEACKAFGDIVWCDELDELVSRASGRQALAVVADLSDRWQRPSAEAISSIRQSRPNIPIVVWCERAGARGEALTSIIDAGVSAIIFRDESGLEQRLLSALTQGSDVAFQLLTDQALSRRVPDVMAPVVRFILDRAAAMPSAEMIAATVGLSRRQLASELRRVGLPPLSVLIAWSKLLTAAYRLERSTDSVTTVARSVGFSTASALSRKLDRWSNESVRAIREPGGFGWVLRCFERYLSKRRLR